jgi:predicted O-linked N-acetylglucosamine transferase (SPINDLY family)
MRLLDQAIAAHQKGNIAEAESLYRRILADDSRDFDALHMLGVLCAQRRQMQEAELHLRAALSVDGRFPPAIHNYGKVLAELGRYEEAVVHFEKALAAAPNFAPVYSDLGNALHELGRLDAALASYDKALNCEPRLADAWIGRGNTLWKLKRHQDALAAYERALSVNSGLANAWLGHGNVAYDLGRYDEASAAYDKAISLNPGLANAWLGRGNVFGERRSFDEALAAYASALELNPNLAGASLGRGNVLYAQKRHEEAHAAYDRALALNPELAEAWLGCGNVAFERRHYEEALTAHGRALALKPDLAEAWTGHGNAALELRSYPEALAAFDKAIALEPELAEAWLGRGIILRTIDRRDEALAAYDRTLALKPDSAEAWQGRGSVLLETGESSEALAAFDKALALMPDYSEALSNRIFALDFADAGFEEQQKARRYWWERIGAPIAQSASVQHINSRDPERRIKVGYVSADFRNHSATRCTRPVLLNHNKRVFEITCYSCSPLEDEVTADCRRAADRWRNVTQASDEELHAQIVADGIDILVDLSGHTAGHRLTVFARKPAPVQVNGWGHATGTGLPVIDYLLSDPVACPASVRHLFAEKVYDLPAINTIEPVPAALQPSDAPMLTRGYVTFGVFNRAGKITDEAVALWSRILHAVEGSRLLFKDTAFDEAAMRGRQRERFAPHGVAPDRIAFLGRTSRPEHLAAFAEVDISLDPFPQNGGISALESMQMGVPLVALLGNSIASRAAGALLASIGMPDWVADTADGYLEIAKKFASMPDYLKALRAELPSKVAASAAGNPAVFTKAVESAYRTMWTEYCCMRG